MTKQEIAEFVRKVREERENDPRIRYEIKKQLKTLPRETQSNIEKRMNTHVMSFIAYLFIIRCKIYLENSQGASINTTSLLLIGNFLTASRKNEKLKQKDIVGVSNETVAKMESGNKDYYMGSFFKYCDSLKIIVAIEKEENTTFIAYKECVDSENMRCTLKDIYNQNGRQLPFLQNAESDTIKKIALFENSVSNSSMKLACWYASNIAECYLCISGTSQYLLPFHYLQIVDALKSFRIDAGPSISAFSKQSGINKATILLMESKKKDTFISMNTFFKYTNTLNLTISIVPKEGTITNKKKCN